MKRYIEKLRDKYNMNLKDIYYEENILIDNIKEYLSKSEYIKIDSFDDKKEEYIFYIRKDFDSEYLKYKIRFEYEDIKIYQLNEYRRIERDYKEYIEIQIFSMNIYIFEYNLEFLFELIIRFIEKNINYINEIEE